MELFDTGNIYIRGKCCMKQTVGITMSSSISLTTNNLKELNRDIEYLLNSTDDEITKKCLTAEIVKEIRVMLLKKWIKVLIIVAFVISQIYVLPFLNWNASAIGRIVMIKVLKIWDWRYLYNVECLIERKVDGSDHIPISIDAVENDCSFCENIEDIRHDLDVSYSKLKSNYIDRGYPVVIEDHQPHSEDGNLYGYIERIKNLTDLIDSNPCNLQTNLVTGLHYRNLNDIFELIESSRDGWFLHYRNCDFSAVKASRALHVQPPFLISHLKPFSSSWILISSIYKTSKPKKLLVKHLVVVKQIIGSTYVLIAPKVECKEFCSDFEFHLEVGDSFVFSAELWDFSYYPSAEGEAVTSIREYELQI
ncbi:uncharacterized protein LOC119084447 [Bradysia coprophila]|uniref:uncharacterized protein LOC119084447 n=1 Tax=Bradysia coprophila TaxID=38358 RepID=UPI00187DD5A3|nr:uncharacterized protein LOC119084447 [Bradysia coprophila]